jgi:hypothetical protein
MVSVISQRVYSRRTRMSIVSENAPRYRRSAKKVKSQLLDELCSILHYQRKYLSFLLRHAGREVYTPQGLRIVADPEASLVSRRGRKKVYTEEFLPYLVVIWELAGCLSSVHLASFIEENQDFLFSRPALFQTTMGQDIPPDMKEKLLTISPATIDRLLHPVREKRKIRGRYTPNPYNSSLKKAIPVQPHYEKPRDLFGYLECDLVHHCGQCSGGHFVYTLTATEITTGWTELRALRNKAQVWAVNALKEVIQSVPFTVAHLHSDNGSEFINAHLEGFTSKKKIPFTRSRPLQKNDAPYAESKNWSLVRVYTGYRRYDTEKELAILRPMVELISLKHNLFIPTMKLTEKRREGGKVKKKYSVETPYRRLMKSTSLTDEEKRRLAALRASTDFFALVRRIAQLQDHLDRAYHKKYHSKEVVCV